jgi:hypothetical protein
VNLAWNGIAVTGTTLAQGFASASFPGESAFSSANAAAFVAVGGLDWRRGRLNWTGFIGSAVGGSAFATGPVRPRDPVTFVIRDDVGSVIESGSLLSVLLDLNIRMDGGTEVEVYNPAEYYWDPARGFFTNAADFILNVTIDSPFVPLASRGSLVLVSNSGIVTEAHATGRYSTIALPGVGTPVGAGILRPGL